MAGEAMRVCGARRPVFAPSGEKGLVWQDDGSRESYMATLNLGEGVDETERALLIGKLLIVGGITLTIIAQVGEVLHWWNDFGEFATLVGIVGTGIGLAITLLMGATRTQVLDVANGVRASNLKLDASNRKLEEVAEGVHASNRKLEEVAEGVHSSNRKLDEVNGKHDETNRKLDVMTAVLIQIRDRL